MGNDECNTIQDLPTKVVTYSAIIIKYLDDGKIASAVSTLDKLIDMALKTMPTCENKEGKG